MKRGNSLRDTLMEELSELLSAEDRLIGVLPKMAEASQSSSLKAVLEDHLEIAKEHAFRLHDIFSNLGENPPRVNSEVVTGLVQEMEFVVNKTRKCPTLDAAIINLTQGIEQYAIPKYQTAHEHASALGYSRMVELLNETIFEERAINSHLSEVAHYSSNALAVNPFDPPWHSILQ